MARKPLSILDLGCAGGGFVAECVQEGHDAVGIEGSDINWKTQRAEWKTIPERLFCCDATAGFTLLADGSSAVFDVITSWEFLEHIAENNIPALVRNVDKHLAKGGIWIASIADFPDCDGDVSYLQTVQNREWWIQRFQQLGFVNRPRLVGYFENEWVRGPLQGSEGFRRSYPFLRQASVRPGAIRCDRPTTGAHRHTFLSPCRLEGSRVGGQRGIRAASGESSIAHSASIRVPPLPARPCFSSHEAAARG